MAITRLHEFIEVAETNWTYGDFLFGYEGEVNQDHNILYPLLVMTPPSSRIPDIYRGYEHYDVELQFYNSFTKAAKDAVTLQQRWDNLQDLALEWLDRVLINYSGGIITSPQTTNPTPTQVYIDKETLVIDRDKDSKNDRLIKLTMSFDMRMFTKCFTKTGKLAYPDNFEGLVQWLRADSGVTWDIPTKQVTTWKDYSPIVAPATSTRDFTQASSSKKPLRYNYDGAEDKTRIQSDGSDDQMAYVSATPTLTCNINNAFTIFVIQKTNESIGGTNIGALYSVVGDSNSEIFVGYRGDLNYIITKDTNGLEMGHGLGNAQGFQIMCTRFKYEGGTATVTSRINEGSASTTTSAEWEGATSFTTKVATLGHKTGVTNRKYKGEACELIIYNQFLTVAEETTIRNYLNTKYKIY